MKWPDCNEDCYPKKHIRRTSFGNEYFIEVGGCNDRDSCIYLKLLEKWRHDEITIEELTTEIKRYKFGL